MKIFPMNAACAACACALAFFSFAGAAHAASLEVSGWIPYWRADEGIADARRHLSDLDAIHPFGYSVDQNGNLSDLFGFNDSSWKRLAKSARSKDVLVVPTVMWSDGAAIHRVLSDPRLRDDHVEEIAEMVSDGNYDGVDIDYEGKFSITMNQFSEFLKELRDELDSSAILSCTIEARTPPESLYAVLPPVISYANDYAALDRYCDRVNIMAYDQGRADIRLNSEKRGSPYIPVADADWVRKVVEHAAQTIDRDKIVLGVATYGYEYEAVVSPDWFRDYRRLWSFSPNYADDISDEYNVDPSRNKAGELSLTYLPKSSPLRLRSSLDIPRNTPEGDEIAQRALAYANATGQTVTFNILWWSDAEAIEEKAELAEELGLKGIAIFRIDGGEDRDIWDIF